MNFVKEASKAYCSDQSSSDVNAPLKCSTTYWNLILVDCNLHVILDYCISTIMQNVFTAAISNNVAVGPLKVDNDYVLLSFVVRVETNHKSRREISKCFRSDQTSFAVNAPLKFSTITLIKLVATVFRLHGLPFRTRL